MDMKDIMKTGEKLLNTFRINKRCGVDTKLNKLTNKILLKELVDHFNTELEELSVGERMLYPMAFNVLMHPDDYGPREESLPFVLPEVVSNFYKIIKKRRVDYPNFIPTATFWHFQFSACEFKEIEGKHGENRIVEKGKIATMASLMTFDLSQENTTTETNIRFSIKPQNSVVNGNKNINMEAIRRLIFMGNSSFSFTFDKNLNLDTNSIKAESDMANIKGWAKLTYSNGAYNTHYEMKDNLIHISGKNEIRKTRSVFILENESINDSHVQIRFLPSKNQFQIAAFGETRLNGRALQLSEGGTLNWYNLPDNSQIFMNGTVAVQFKIN